MHKQRSSTAGSGVAMNPRRYGRPPYLVVVVHGGPGAAGEMAPVAEELARHAGVLEPLQTRDSIAGQVEELKEQLEQTADGPATLIGYSWGAWLSYLVAAQYPALVRKLILVSSGPFEARYAEQIERTRTARMTDADRTRLQQVLARLHDPQVQDRDGLFAEFGEVFARIDAYSPMPNRGGDLQGSFAIYQRVWEEASRLRHSGALLAIGTRLACPVVALHGEHDPHPAEGVREPLRRVLRDFRFVLLERCGHTPWIEVEAAETFYQLLRDELPADNSTELRQAPWQDAGSAGEVAANHAKFLRRLQEDSI